MSDLTKFTMRDMSELGAALRQLGSGAKSMEEVATRIVRHLYDHLVDMRSGERSCALVRLFKTHPYKDLDVELQESVCQMIGDKTVSPAMKCLVLLATAGDKPEWNSRKLSVRHKAIPLQSPEMVEAFPMISSLISQFGLEITQLLKPEPNILVELEQRTYNVFYVPRALGSPHVYAQEEFVIPFGIQSVLGFGAILPSGNLFTVILFSKVPIPREAADLFAPIALSVKLALLPFDGRVVFAPHNPATSGKGSRQSKSLNHEVRRLNSQVGALEQLLEVYEKAVVDQTTRLERTLEERGRLVEEVDAQRRLFQTVIENAPVGIALLLSPNFVYELVNPTYQAIAPGKLMVGRTFVEVWPEEGPPLLPILAEALRTQKPYHADDVMFKVRRQPGAPFEETYFTFSFVPVRVSGSEFDAVLHLSIETTEQVRARARIEDLAAIAQRRAAELQAVLDNMVDAVYVCNAEGRIILANEAGLLLLGVTNLKEVTRALAEFPELLRMRHLDGRPIVPEELPLARALAGETVGSDDEVFFSSRIRQDVYIRVSASPIRDERGGIAGAVAVAKNVTELLELNRMKDQFISLAAHELKTPVTGIRGYAQLLLRREHEGVSAAGLKALEAINRQTDKISRLVNELLDVSRLQAGRLELHRDKFDLTQLVAETLERMKLTTEKHRFRLELPGPVIVDADRDRIEEVVSTLLDNAIKFSPQGKDIETNVSIIDGEAVVSVQDHGVGIPRDRQAHIFELFYRAHSGTPYDFGGMGVGLYISKEIITRHGGKMWFESREGRGSTFYFSLPSVLADSDRPAVVSS